MRQWACSTTSDAHQQDGIEQVGVERRLVPPMASDVLARTVNHVGHGQLGERHRGGGLRQLGQGGGDVTVFCRRRNTVDPMASQ